MAVVILPKASMKKTVNNDILPHAATTGSTIHILPVDFADNLTHEYAIEESFQESTTGVDVNLKAVMDRGRGLQAIHCSKCTTNHDGHKNLQKDNVESL